MRQDGRAGCRSKTDLNPARRRTNNRQVSTQPAPHARSMPLLVREFQAGDLADVRMVATPILKTGAREHRPL
jgi:hypothetical protein